MRHNVTMKSESREIPWSRRELLWRSALGFGWLALTNLLEPSRTKSAEIVYSEANPLSARPAPQPARAKSVIHLFLNGGLSQVDSFDPKPALEKYAGKPLPIENPKTEFKTGGAFPSPFAFHRYGESGLEISDMFPHLGTCADDLCVIRSMHTDLPNHEPALLMMNCGEARISRPSVGSWVTYGLGSENQNLPGFIAMCPGGYPIQESQNWQSGFLPGAFQGTFINSQHTDIALLIENIRNESVPLEKQRSQLALLQAINGRHNATRGGDAQLEARIQSFELAFRMQGSAAEAFDISQESKATLESYGEGIQARQMLIARRLVERGVRFVQVWNGAQQPWDNHSDIANAHGSLARQCDQPIAALIKDLKGRGLLDETLIVCSGEFGRTPTMQLPGGTGRDHNHYGFSLWMAGGGVRGGYAHGATDDFGYRAVENKVHVHDLHATILHLLGFDHKQLVYRYAGRDFRLTDVHGEVVHSVVA